MTTYSDAYDVILNFKLRSDGKFSVGETLHGYPFLGTGSPIPHVGGAYSSDGQGGAAPNHLHWHVIALEPHLKMDGPAGEVVNQLHVVRRCWTRNRSEIARSHSALPQLAAVEAGREIRV